MPNSFLHASGKDGGKQLPLTKSLQLEILEDGRTFQQGLAT